jgi:hypothetical protein
VSITFIVVDCTECTYFAGNDIRGEVSLDAGYDGAEGGSRDRKCNKTRERELHDSGEELEWCRESLCDAT